MKYQAYKGESTYSEERLRVGFTVRIALPIFLSAFVLQAILGVSTAVAAPVQQPQLLKQIKWTGTSWFASPIIHNLGSGDRKLIGTFYDIFVWDKNFNELARARSGASYPHEGRIYAPAVCADLDGDGIYEIVVGSGNGKVAAYEWRNNTLSVKAGWPASACDAGQCPEVRGLAAGDLNGDGKIEIVATTTQTAGGAQVFVFNPDGTLYQPPGLSYRAWPRYNRKTGPGNDADANGPGNHGYGCYGLNVGIGNLNDDPFQEIVVTFDNHQINVFHHDGVSMLASPYFTNRSGEYDGNRLNWGQFIRWFDPTVEENHYHLHTGDWPHPSFQKWMQWTESPPSVADVNGDEKNEVICVSNVEMDEPYDTKHHSVMVLEGSYGDGDRSARRLPGWESLPFTDYPLSRAGRTWYPPTNPPSPTVVNITGDSRPEIIFGGHDGYVYCISPNAERLWRVNITHDRAMMYASEVVVADLNQDNTAELILTTFGDPDSIAPGTAHGYLMILDSNGNILYDLELPEQGTDGNGKGAPAAPTVMDLNGDGTLEIVVQTFGAGCFVYTVPGSAENQLLWPTGRGNYLRDGGNGVRACTLLSPNGGNTIATGSTFPIEWEAIQAAATFKLKYSLDSGLTWLPIEPAGSFTDTRADWAVPLLKKNKRKCLIKVVAFDASGNKLGSDTSDGPFTIEALTITDPISNDTCTSGQPCLIAWNRSDYIDAHTGRLSYSTNGGLTWKLITKTITGSDTSYSSWVPTVRTTKRNCKVKLVYKNDKGVTVGIATSEKFTINGP